jgi:tetratricopeptide (TPR) repeat protein
MQELHQRALLYGGASLLLAGIGYVWATHSAEADAMTLLSSADVQLRLAYAIPAVDKQGKVLETREEMIAQAERYLADVERIEPGMAVTAEFLGFAHSLRGRFVEAAAAYARARQCQDCGAEQRDVLAFNEARMLAQGGKLEPALAAFTREAKALDRRFGHQRSLEEATILRQLGRTADAEQRLATVLNDDTAQPMASLQAGLEYLELGKPAAAEQAFTRAAPQVPIADYHLARLKLQAGDVDTCLGLLERVAAAQPAEVRRRLREEAGAWSAVTTDARFQELVSPRTATPVR